MTTECGVFKDRLILFAFGKFSGSREEVETSLSALLFLFSPASGAAAMLTSMVVGGSSVKEKRVSHCELFKYYYF